MIGQTLKRVMESRGLMPTTGCQCRRKVDKFDKMSLPLTSGNLRTMKGWITQMSWQRGRQVDDAENQSILDEVVLIESPKSPDPMDLEKV